MRLFTPSEGPIWLKRFADSVLDAFKQVMDAPLRLWSSAAADLPAPGDYAGGLGWNATASRIAYSDGVAWHDVQPADPTLDALAAFNASGLVAQTAPDSFAGRSIVGPAAGLVVTNGNGVGGNPTLSLANDLAALEGLSGTGLARRTGIDAWSVGGVVAVAEGGTGDSGTAWASFAPTWSNLSVGNGTVVAAYKQIGKLVWVRLRLVLGSTSAVTGLITASRPVNAASYGGSVATSQGFARFYDSSAGAVVEGLVSNLAANVAQVVLLSLGVSGGFVAGVETTAASPFAWAAGDELMAQYFYEAA